MGEPQLVQIAFAGSIDESQPAEVLDPTQAFTVLENGRTKQTGGYAKRLGFEEIPSTRMDGSSRSAGLRTFAAGPDGKQICVIDGVTLDEYSPALGRWVTKGPVPEPTCTPLPVPSVAFGQSSPTDIAALNGYTAIAWSAITQNDAAAQKCIAVLAVMDSATGAVILPPTTIGGTITGSTTSIALATYGTYIVALFNSVTANAIDGVYLDTTSATTVALGWQVIAGHICTDMNGNEGRVVSLTGASAIAIAYLNTTAPGGASQLTVRSVNISGSVASKTLTTATTPVAWDLVEGGSTLWVVWSENTSGNVKAQGLDPTNITSTLVTLATVFVAAPGTYGVSFDVRVSQMSGGGAAVYVKTSAALLAQAIRNNAGAPATNGTLGVMASMRLQSRPFLIGSKVYAHCSSRTFSANLLSNDIALCEVTPDTTNVALVAMYLRPVAAPTERGIYVSYLDTNPTPNARVAALGNGQYVWAFTTQKSGTTQATSATVYDFANPARWRAATVNGSTTVLSGGIASVFDGVKLTELGFVSAPAPPVPTVGAAGAVSLTVGRRYAATFVDTDANGDTHVSGVSLTGFLAGPVASKKINVALQGPLTMTSRGMVAGSHLVYGTQNKALRLFVWATADGGQPPYYYAGEITNDPTGGALIFVDNVADADLISNALLYGTGNLPGTNGASQDHRAPPGLTHLVAYNGMLVGAAGSTLWYSSQPIDGEGQWFSPVFTVPLDDIVTGLEVMDGTLFAFTRRHIFAVTGDPPADNGSSGGLGTPRRIASQDGCIDSNSIRATTLGIVFQSQRGIELLNRGAAVDYWGSQVRVTLANYPVVQSVVVDRQNALIRISLGQSRSSGVVSGATGRDVVYDTTTGGWVSVDRRFGSGADQPAQDACVVFFNGAYRYAWLATDGTLYVERDASDPSAYLDGSQWIARAAETAKFKVSGIQGRQLFGRALMLERYTTDHDASVALSYNYEASYRTPQVYSAATINGLLSAGWPITQLQHDAHNDGESQAVGIRVTDATPSSGTVGNGAASTWLALTLEVTPQPGAFEVPEGAT
jgi:hypothetical protein